MAEQFWMREGHYPSCILADKIYRNRENLNYCKAHGIRPSGPALGRPKQGKPETRLRITGMRANVWKWSAGSVWQSVCRASCAQPFAAFDTAYSVSGHCVKNRSEAATTLSHPMPQHCAVFLKKTAAEASWCTISGCVSLGSESTGSIFSTPL